VAKTSASAFMLSVESSGGKTSVDGRSAQLSGCGTYRYTLDRWWQGGVGMVLFVMLNPSTADAFTDDPTVRKCIGFAKRWGFERLRVVNLFAYRATQPRDLAKASRPVGPANDAYIFGAATESQRIVAAWGANGHFKNRDRAVRRLLQSYRLECLRMTKGYAPEHPLYVPYDITPIEFKKAGFV
jgi:hypothetical protein